MLVVLFISSWKMVRPYWLSIMCFIIFNSIHVSISNFNYEIVYKIRKYNKHLSVELISKYETNAIAIFLW